MAPGTGKLEKTDDIADGALRRRIVFFRSLAKIVLLAERLAPAALLPLGVVALYMAAAWFGLFRLVPPILVKPLALAFALAFVWTLRDLFRVRWPSDADALRRLENESGLAHRALSALEDRPATGGRFADALWREHKRRMARNIGQLTAGAPAPGISAYDPHALRAIPVLALAVAFGFSWSNQSGRLTDPWHIVDMPSEVAGLRIDAWVTPPLYTHKPPVFLTEGQASASPEPPAATLAVPDGSVLTVRLSGKGTDTPVTFLAADGGEPVTLTEEKATTDAPGAPPGQAGRTFQLPLNTAGTLAAADKRWTFDIIRDRPPEIAFDGEPQRALNGALEIHFKAHDDYGLESARAVIEPVDQETGAIPLFPAPEFRLELPHRNAPDAASVTSHDLTEHPLSGTSVRVTLVATDAAGQEGRSEPKEIVLPERNFREPLAAAVAEERQVFSLDVRRLGRAIELNDALYVRPEETIPDLTQFLLLQSAGQRMRLARSEADLKDTADYLWQIALGIDGGEAANAERKVRDAQQALADALNRNASDAEIKKLMDELRKAMDEFMNALARQMQNNPDQNRMSADRQKMIRQQDLQKMMDEIQKLAESGARDEARNLLNQMQRMMNNMQTARPGDRNNPANDRMRQQIDKLGNLLQEQKRLMDETFGKEQALRDRMQRGDPGEGENGEQLFEDQPLPGGLQDQADNQDQQGNPMDSMTEEELRQALKELSQRQKGLEKDLSDLQGELRKLGIKPGEGFKDAGKEMKDATGSLGKGQGEEAVGSQGRAIDALRKGASELMQQLAKGNNGGQQMGGGQQRGTDPLGRQQGSNGADFGEGVKVPDQFDAERARQILDAIRRKLGDNLSPELERQYLERLLDLR